MQGWGVRVCFSLCKPDTDLGRLNSCLLKKKVSKGHGFGDCVFRLLIIVDRLDSIIKSRKRLLNGFAR
jgi:hypothetical protein